MTFEHEFPDETSTPAQNERPAAGFSYAGFDTEQPANPEPFTGPKSAVPMLALVFGFIGLGFTGLLLTLPLGVLFTIVALVFGLISRKRHQRYGGLLVAQLSLLLLLLWIASAVVPIAVDPTLFK